MIDGLPTRKRANASNLAGRKGCSKDENYVPFGKICSHDPDSRHCWSPAYGMRGNERYAKTNDEEYSSTSGKGNINNIIIFPR